MCGELIGKMFWSVLGCGGWFGDQLNIQQLLSVVCYLLEWCEILHSVDDDGITCVRIGGMGCIFQKRSESKVKGRRNGTIWSSLLTFDRNYQSIAHMSITW